MIQGSRLAATGMVAILSIRIVRGARGRMSRLQAAWLRFFPVLLYA
jgi:hypothetical protein